MSLTRATTNDLYAVPENGKAELVNGEVVRMSPTGARPGRASLRIVVSLNQHEEGHGGGVAFGDNVGFTVDLPNRGSFSPDAAWHTGQIGEDDLDFVGGAPIFAVEVRSKNDYGPQAERSIREKIADYFAAGTQVVWDVDLLSPDVIRKHTAGRPDSPQVFHRGEQADAEPAVPAWRFSVDRLFS